MPEVAEPYWMDETKAEQEGEPQTKEEAVTEGTAMEAENLEPVPKTQEAVQERTTSGVQEAASEKGNSNVPENDAVAETVEREEKKQPAKRSRKTSKSVGETSKVAKPGKKAQTEEEKEPAKAEDFL